MYLPIFAIRSDVAWHPVSLNEASKPFFSIGWWLIRCCVMIQKVSLKQIVAKKPDIIPKVDATMN